MTELIIGLLGGGSLVSLVTAFLQHKQKKDESKLSWYDRAVKQVEFQDETIRKLREYIGRLEDKNRSLLEENHELKDMIDELEDIVENMEKEKRSLIAEITNYRAGKQKE